MKEFIIGEDDAARRVDRVARKLLKDIPLSGIYRILRKGGVKVNGKKVKGNYTLQVGDSLQVMDVLLQPPFAHTAREPSASFSPSPQAALHAPSKTKTEKFTANVLYRDADFLILNKSPFQLVHGEGSLDEEVKAAYAQSAAAEKSLSFAPGPLHRLDAGTSGILVFSQSLKGAQVFSEKLREGKILRYYLALVFGKAPDEAEFTSDIGGKRACTKCKRIRYLPEKNLSLAEIQILTGRKHQIRIHCAENGFPLLGDTQFGSDGSPHARSKTDGRRNGKLRQKKSKSTPQADGYFLHFYKMVLTEKILQLPPVISCPPPERFAYVLGDEAVILQ